MIQKSTPKTKVMLNKMTDDMLERLESQLADTIAFVATFIATADNTEKATFHPCLKFLANWLECEDRAVTR